MPNSIPSSTGAQLTSFSVDLLSEEFSAQDKLNQQFIKKQLQSIPYAFRVIAKNTYNRLCKLPKLGEFIANTYFRELGEFCRNLPIDITWNESQLKLVAKSRSDMCFGVASNMLNQGDEGDEVLQHLESILLHIATIESQLEKNIVNLSSQQPIRIFTQQVLIEAINEFSDKNEIELDYPLTEQQKESVKLSISKRISIIAGYGGTGKTTVLKATVDVAEQQLRSVFILALAGKAKERAREAIGKDDITFTIHGFIKMTSNPKNKAMLTTPLIIIDEASMVDIVLANRLMNVLHGTNFSMCLVGYTAQLSPVGMGLFFHACVNKLDTINLTKVHRQAETSLIHKLAMVVREGKMSEIKEWNHEKEGVFFVTCEPSQKDLIKSIISITSTQMGQIISPHASHYMSDNTATINNSMQYIHNQKTKVSLNMGSRILKVNDPIMVTVNNYELELFNGMTGIIEDIELVNNQPNIIAQFNNLTYSLSKNQCFELGIELAYAITIHKSQGSEYDMTIICCINSSKLLERSMVYTALTRSKKLTLFVGDRNVLHNAVIQPPRSETICHGFQV